MLIDTHAHLNDKRFDNDREEVIARCMEDGLVCIINAGSSLSSSIKSVSIWRRRYSIIYATVGIHPHDAKTADRLYDRHAKALWPARTRWWPWGNRIGLSL
jgi:TatD DNase family protein